MVFAIAISEEATRDGLAEELDGLPLRAMDNSRLKPHPKGEQRQP